MKTFRVYFADGNVKLYEGAGMVNIMQYLMTYYGMNTNKITKIEEVKDGTK